MRDVSIIIPVFNRADTIGRAVRSCLVQPCLVEVVIVDDGSTDSTREVIEKTFRSELQVTADIRYIAQSNQGVCAARNRGLYEATGEFVKFLDSDDELVADALGEELRVARESKADVVVSAWEERCWGDGHELIERRRQMPCPVLNRGIDDMLMGESPWTAAALYRRAFVACLKWNADFGKADDWGWAWTVCLAGARFAMMDGVSAVYWHHEGERITSVPTAFHDSTVVRQRILAMVESSLERMKALTDARRQALSQYYYKDRLVVCDGSIEAWRQLCQHCRKLAPGFRLREPHPVVRPLVSMFGVFWGVRFYVMLRRCMRCLSRSRAQVGVLRVPQSLPERSP